MPSNHSFFFQFHPSPTPSSRRPLISTTNLHRKKGCSSGGNRGGSSGFYEAAAEEVRGGAASTSQVTLLSSRKAYLGVKEGNASIWKEIKAVVVIAEEEVSGSFREVLMKGK
ncbi:unnamed protein product [Linum trigynum]|uniref:Uncharacterized protein n=1 Tax=Linum trigynum TaxID=586398 RepID=A0AAV2F7F4_9ROSI